VAKQNIPPLVEVTDSGKIIYRFHDGQQKAWSSFKRFILVLSGTQGGKCLAFYSKVLIKGEGSKRIEDVEQGDEVWSYDEKAKKIVSSKVLHRIDSGILPIYHVATATGKQVDVSETHPFLTKTGWKKIKLIEVGDDIAVHEKTDDDDVGIAKWDQVTEIKYIGEEHCYDLEIENHHNFIANNIFVHNTSFAPLWLHKEMQRAYLEDHGHEVTGIDSVTGQFMKSKDEIYNIPPTAVGEGTYLALTASYDLFKVAFLPIMREFFEDTLKIGRYWTSARIIEIKNPATGKFMAKTADDPMYARIVLRSADSTRGLESSTARAALFDEIGMDEVRLGAWEALLRRLSLAQGRVLCTTTLYNFGFLHDLYEQWQKGDPDYYVVQFPSIANPRFPLEEFERAKRSMPAWRFAMMYEGLYEKPAGMIFSDFDSTIHKVKPFLIPENWQRHVGIDPGAVHTGMVWIAEDRAKGVFYVYRTTLDGNKTTAQHVAQALDYGETVTNWVGGAKSEEQFRMDWMDAGIRVQKPLVSEVEPGIDRVISLFKTNRLFIFDTCGLLLDEIGTYSRVLDTHGEPTDAIKDKNTFHTCFVAGTKITTINGDRNIEDIELGDLVLTRKGYRPVIDCGMTYDNTDVMTVKFSNGKELTGTPEHPIWVEGNGWNRMDALRYGYILSDTDTNTPNKKHARIHVENVSAPELLEKRSVYNLTVADAHEYYANGILVSNCDALRYIAGKLSKPPTNAVPIDKSRFGAKTIPGFGTIHKVPSMGVAIGGGHIPCM